MKTDRQLQQDVIDELNWEPSVEATTIGVEVKDGIVILAGHVPSYTQKWAAEKAAQRVAGVKGIVVEIEVALPDANKRNDTDIVRAASDALKWNTLVPKNAIKILVEDGAVTLSGEVDWAYQRTAAVDAVRNLLGVLRVNDRIGLKHRATVPDIQKKIESALQRQAHFDAKAITVAMDGATVTLGGVVDSWSERTAARNAAWSAPGVQNVVDNLSVAD